MFNTAEEHKIKWKLLANQSNAILVALLKTFDLIENNNIRFEDGRDNMRAMLHDLQPHIFPYGQVGTDIIQLFSTIVQCNCYVPYRIFDCVICERQITSQLSYIYPVIYCHGRQFEQYIKDKTKKRPTMHSWYKKLQHLNQAHHCSQCGHLMDVQCTRGCCPNFIAFHMTDKVLDIKRKIPVKCGSRPTTMTLIGIVYYRLFHFAVQFLDKENMVWFHDGQSMKEECELDGNFDNITQEELQSTRMMKVCLVIYTK